MNSPATSVSETLEKPNPLARADALEREITDLCAQINAAGYRLLQLVAELDDEKPWGARGLRSCAHWLNWRCGIGMNAAREKVRVAHALKNSEFFNRICRLLSPTKCFAVSAPEKADPHQEESGFREAP